MERGSEISLPPHRPPAMVLRSHPPAVGRVRGRGPARGRNMARIPCRNPAMVLLGRGQGSKSPLGPCPPPPMGQASRPSSAMGQASLPSQPMGLASNILDSIAAELGHFGMILLLLETPSGFAVFSFCGLCLYEPHAMENLWTNFTVDYKARRVAFLREFQTFDDKFSAIDPFTGVNEKLKNMIMKWLRPGQKLAVGKIEYKMIIESTMVNKQIITTACALFYCDSTEKKHAVPLFLLARLIKDVSGIYTDNWNSLKLATALKVIFCPEEVGDYHEMFSEDERSKLVDDAHQYTCKIGMRSALKAYKEMVSAYEVRNEKKILLRKLVMEAKVRMKVEEELQQ